MDLWRFIFIFFCAFVLQHGTTQAQTLTGSLLSQNNPPALPSTQEATPPLEITADESLECHRGTKK